MYVNFLKLDKFLRCLGEGNERFSAVICCDLVVPAPMAILTNILNEGVVEVWRDGGPDIAPAWPSQSPCLNPNPNTHANVSLPAFRGNDCRQLRSVHTSTSASRAVQIDRSLLYCGVEGDDNVRRDPTRKYT